MSIKLKFDEIKQEIIKTDSILKLLGHKNAELEELRDANKELVSKLADCTANTKLVENENAIIKLKHDEHRRLHLDILRKHKELEAQHLVLQKQIEMNYDVKNCVEVEVDALKSKLQTAEKELIDLIEENCRLKSLVDNLKENEQRLLNEVQFELQSKERFLKSGESHNVFESIEKKEVAENLNENEHSPLKEKAQFKLQLQTEVPKTDESVIINEWIEKKPRPNFDKEVKREYCERISVNEKFFGFDESHCDKEMDWNLKYLSELGVVPDEQVMMILSRFRHTPELIARIPLRKKIPAKASFNDVQTQTNARSTCTRHIQTIFEKISQSTQTKSDRTDAHTQTGRTSVSRQTQTDVCRPCRAKISVAKAVNVLKRSRAHYTITDGKLMSYNRNLLRTKSNRIVRNLLNIIGGQRRRKQSDLLNKRRELLLMRARTSDTESSSSENATRFVRPIVSEIESNDSGCVQSDDFETDRSQCPYDVFKLLEEMRDHPGVLEPIQLSPSEDLRCTNVLPAEYTDILDRFEDLSERGKLSSPTENDKKTKEPDNRITDQNKNCGADSAANDKHKSNQNFLLFRSDDDDEDDVPLIQFTNKRKTVDEQNERKKIKVSENLAEAVTRRSPELRAENDSLLKKEQSANLGNTNGDAKLQKSLNLNGIGRPNMEVRQNLSGPEKPIHSDTTSSKQMSYGFNKLPINSNVAKIKKGVEFNTIGIAKLPQSNDAPKPEPTQTIRSDDGITNSPNTGLNRKIGSDKPITLNNAEAKNESICKLNDKKLPELTGAEIDGAKKEGKLKLPEIEKLICSDDLTISTDSKMRLDNSDSFNKLQPMVKRRVAKPIKAADNLAKLKVVGTSTANIATDDNSTKLRDKTNENASSTKALEGKSNFNEHCNVAKLTIENGVESVTIGDNLKSTESAVSIAQSFNIAATILNNVGNLEPSNVAKTTIPGVADRMKLNDVEKIELKERMPIAAVDEILKSEEMNDSKQIVTNSEETDESEDSGNSDSDAPACEAIIFGGKNTTDENPKQPAECLWDPRSFSQCKSQETSQHVERSIRARPEQRKISRSLRRKRPLPVLDKNGILRWNGIYQLLKYLMYKDGKKCEVEKIAKIMKKNDKLHKIILRFVLNDTSKLEEVETLFEPRLTKLLKIVLGLLDHLEREMPGFTETLLAHCEAMILHKLEVPKHIERATRFYVAVCKMRGEVYRMRRTLYDGLYFMGNGAVVLLYHSVLSWVELLVVNKNRSKLDELFKDNPLNKVLIKIVYLKKCFPPEYCLGPLKTMMEKIYNYPKDIYGCDQFMKEFLEQYIYTRKECYAFAMLILCRNNPAQWTLKQAQLIKELICVIKDSKIVKMLFALIAKIGKPYNDKETCTLFTNLMDGICTEFPQHNLTDLVTTIAR